ncbi:DNA polymerase III subunit delta [Metabacillus arenae]|uniref:DNA polymerase III subunit delta n=1 Tax=Metabacillus arenae TaxID=2771434 RepID=A0A926RYH3_9BACI|nr:DNA polymerase III subunit delta [Metabacillus arenae]MBD1382081.1 DNA polymerase III subunit delta [Metabacillus arenae]
MVLKIWQDIEKGKLHPLFLVTGTENFLLQETTKKIVQAGLNEEEKDFNLSVHDMEETSVDVAIEDAETLPFLGEKRIVIIQNPVFLTAEKKKEKIDHNLDRLIQYIQEPAPFTTMVFSAPYEKLDERKKITKLIKKQAQIVEAKNLSNNETELFIHSLAKQEGNTIESAAVLEIMFLTNGNLTAISQEMNKLCTYAGFGNDITQELTSQLVARSLEQNIFELIDKVVNKKGEKALQIFYDLLKTNEEPIKILSLITTQFRLILQTKQLSSAGYGQKQIAGNIKIHPYRVKLALEQARLFDEEELKDIIKQLADADYELKTGKKDKKLIIELFLLKLFK